MPYKDTTRLPIYGGWMSKMTTQEKKKLNKLRKDYLKVFKLSDKIEEESNKYTRKIYKLKKPTAIQVKKARALRNKGSKYVKKGLDKAYKYDMYLDTLELKYLNKAQRAGVWRS
tara:strand:- start:372 stop:713 length:342 start_codon:yes stop_codon:yes gene_type:complete